MDNFILKIFSAISIFFLVGGIGVIMIIKKKPEEKKRTIIKYFVYLILVYSICFILSYTHYFYVFSFILIAISFFEIFKVWKENTNRKHIILLISSCVFCVLSFWFIIAATKLEQNFLLVVYTLVLCFDGFCQIAGQLFGKIKIAKKISPNKTLAGLIGGTCVTLATGVFLLVEKNGILVSLIFTLLIMLFAFTGDIFASLYKRICGVKDYSNLIPGHGGVLDRFDSLIFTLGALGLLSLVEIKTIIKI